MFKNSIGEIMNKKLVPVFLASGYKFEKFKQATHLIWGLPVDDSFPPLNTVTWTHYDSFTRLHRTEREILRNIDKVLTSTYISRMIAIRTLIQFIVAVGGIALSLLLTSGLGGVLGSLAASIVVLTTVFSVGAIAMEYRDRIETYGAIGHYRWN
jgi:hypothetical protein